MYVEASTRIEFSAAQRSIDIFFQSLDSLELIWIAFWDWFGFFF